MTERILIVGPGAIGGIFAGYLAAAGKPVTVLARGVTAKLIATEGIRLTTPDMQKLHGRPRVITDATEVGEQDIVLVTTKAFSLPEAMALARPAIGPRTLVAPVLNGVPWWFGTIEAPVRAIDPDGSLVRAVAPENLVGGTTYSPAHRTAAGEWVHTVPGKLTLGASIRGGSTVNAERIARIFEGTAFGAVVSPDVHRAVWSKLVTNGTFNPFCSITGTPQRDIARDERLGPVALAIMREIEALAKAAGSGIQLDNPIEKQFEQARERGIHKPSTLQDFEAGRQVELAAIVEAPLELAARYGVSMPMLSAIGGAARLKAIALGLMPGITSPHQ
ncbi:MAG: 2-dehydropantoate 2-reductase [Burkholderiales bacterium]